MKKNLTFLMLMLSALVSFTACSSDDDGDGLGNKDAGSDNRIDVAVTGAVLEKGETYVVLTGYVNADRITASYTSYKYGIQFSNNPNFKDDDKKLFECWEKSVDELVGNKFTLRKGEMTPATLWYYRTYVKVNGNNYYGETKTFNTDDFVNIATTGDATDITSSSAKIICLADTNKLVNELEHYTNYGARVSIYNTERKVGVAYSTDKSLLTIENMRKCWFYYCVSLPIYRDEKYIS